MRCERSERRWWGGVVVAGHKDTETVTEPENSNRKTGANKRIRRVRLGSWGHWTVSGGFPPPSPPKTTHYFFLPVPSACVGQDSQDIEGLRRVSKPPLPN